MKKVKYFTDKKLFELAFSSVLSLGMVSLGLIVLAPYILNIRSERASINGKIVLIRSPIPGIPILEDYESGQLLNSQEKLGSINNIREDSLILNREKIKGQLAIFQKELENLIHQKERYQYLIEEISSHIDYHAQKAERQKYLEKRKTMLEIDVLKRQVNQVDADLRKKVEEKKIAEREAQRFENLGNKGGVSLNEVEKQRLQANQAEEEVNKTFEQYQEAIIELKTSQSGLSSEQLDYLENIKDTENRQWQLIVQRQQLLTEKINLQNEITEAQTQIQATQNELKQTELQLEINTSVSIKSPIDGPIWSVMAQTYEDVQAGDPILSILDCQRRWVEALFTEANADYLQPGLPVKVNILGPTKQTLKGRIEDSRAGAGRISPGKDIVKYIGEVPKNQVVLRISVEWPEKNNYQEYCYVGRSVEVIVPRFFREKTN